jgi:hypothetical protein
MNALPVTCWGIGYPLPPLSEILHVLAGYLLSNRLARRYPYHAVRGSKGKNHLRAMGFWQ